MADDLKFLKIETPITEIENIPKVTFKRMIKKKIEMKALKASNEEKQKHSKVASINHDEMELQDYQMS